MCLVGNEALSADHKKQKESTPDDWKTFYLCEDDSLTNYKDRNNFIKSHLLMKYPVTI